MAEKRMLSKIIIDSDDFLELSINAQALYFHLVIRADDEGFLNNSKKILKIVGAEKSDLKELSELGFIIIFNSGVIAITHWNLHNCITKNRKKNTCYQEEKLQLGEKENGSYFLLDKNQEKTENKISDDDFNSFGNENKVVEDENIDIAEEKEEYDCHTSLNEEDEIEELENKEESQISEDNTRKNYAQEIFDIFFLNKLPCWNGNFVSFYMSDFKNGLACLKSMHLHSNDVLAAVKNYVQVILLARRGLSWWNSEMSFLSLCKNGAIRKFLPDEFRVENFYKNKNSNLESENLPDDRIRL